MKRIHIGLHVSDVEASIRFYSTLLGAKPCVVKPDYAKWMLEDPRVNLSVSSRQDAPGPLHLGIQVEEESELGEITGRLKQAGLAARETSDVTCCYAKSDKTWTADPAGLPWETFLTRGASTVYGQETLDPSDLETMTAAATGKAGDADCCT